MTICCTHFRRRRVLLDMVGFAAAAPFLDVPRMGTAAAHRVLLGCPHRGAAGAARVLLDSACLAAAAPFLVCGDALWEHPAAVSAT